MGLTVAEKESPCLPPLSPRGRGAGGRGGGAAPRKTRGGGARLLKPPAGTNEIRTARTIPTDRDRSAADESSHPFIADVFRGTEPPRHRIQRGRQPPDAVAASLQLA